MVDQNKRVAIFKQKTQIFMNAKKSGAKAPDLKIKD